MGYAAVHSLYCYLYCYNPDVRSHNHTRLFTAQNYWHTRFKLLELYLLRLHHVKGNKVLNFQGARTASTVLAP